MHGNNFYSNIPPLYYTNDCLLLIFYFFVRFIEISAQYLPNEPMSSFPNTVSATEISFICYVRLLK